jgi:hypothetical protein
MGKFVYHGITKEALLFIESCIGKRDDEGEFYRDFNKELFEYGDIHISTDIQIALNYSINNYCVLKFKVSNDLDNNFQEFFIKHDVTFTNFKYLRFDYCLKEEDIKVSKIQCKVKPYVRNI